MTGHDSDSLAVLAEQALDTWTEAEAEPVLAQWVVMYPADTLVLHWLALLQRALDRRDAAQATVRQALKASPQSAGLAHALAQVTFEAGQPAAALFETAIRLAPANAEVLLGLAAARLAEGDGERALDELGATLDANPGWFGGHAQYAQLCSHLGRADQALASLERMMMRFPGIDDPYRLATDLMLAGQHYDQALDLAERGLRACGDNAELQLARAAALDELGKSEAADVFARLGKAQQPDHAMWRLRHLLRCGDVAAASAELEPWLAADGAETFWPYAALIWRLTGDPRADWLDAQDGLIQVFDLPGEQVDLAELAILLRGLHARSGRFLDQSVRLGTQTDGILLARTDLVIAGLREALRGAVASHVAQLPPADPTHPLLSRRRDRPVRFAGSWSVRLSGAGYHSAHHHPAGWISSAFYVTVPDGLSGDEGKLSVGGAPGDLGLSLPPRVVVAPRPGRLVLFPSWLWHGTQPFAAGERMTVAFDVARP